MLMIDLFISFIFLCLIFNLKYSIVQNDAIVNHYYNLNNFYVF